MTTYLNGEKLGITEASIIPESGVIQLNINYKGFFKKKFFAEKINEGKCFDLYLKYSYYYCDKDVNIDIGELKFEIKNVDKIREYEDIKEDDLNGLEKMIENLIGEGSINKINEKREKDGYGKICPEEMVRSVVNIDEKDIYFGTPQDLYIGGGDIVKDFQE